MTDHLLVAYAEDIRIRSEGLERETLAYLKVDVHEVGPGVVYEREGVRVRAVPVLHGGWKEAYGYRVDTPDRMIVISGDTRPSDALAEAAKGVDILIHEVYPAAKLTPEKRPGGEYWPQYMHEFHTSDVELGQLAARVQPKLLIRDHIVRLGGSDDELLAGIRAGGFTGRVIVGKDLDRF